MKLKIFILLCACLTARAQTPATNQPGAVSAITNREALRRAVRNLGTNAPVSALAVPTNAAKNLPPVPPPPAAPAAPVIPSAAASVPPRTATPAAPAAPPSSPTAQPRPMATPPPASPAPSQPAASAQLDLKPVVSRTNLVEISGADEIIPPGVIKIQDMDIKQVLDIYAELVNRTILRPANLPAPLISLKTQTPLTKREAVDALNAVLGMNGIAMVNIGDKFVKAVPSPQGSAAGAKLGREDPSTFGDIGGYVTHVLQLKFAKPSEMTPILAPFASATVGAAGIQAIDSSQILVLRDFTENVKRMLEFIKEVDIVPTSEFISEVIPIKYALATDISDALNGLSSGSSGTTIGRTGASGGRTGTPGGATTSGFAGGVTQPGTSPTPTALGGQRTGTTGGSFSERLQGILSSARRTTGSGTGDFQILGTMKIIADSRTNSLLIFAGKQDMDTIKEIIAKLDVVLAQVLIESILMEVSLDDSRNVGFSYLQSPQTSGQFTGVGAILNASRFPTARNFGPGDGVNTNNAGAALSSGFSYLANFGGDLDVAIAAVASDSRVNVLSKPRIQTSHAVPASLFIGNTVPYITGTSFGDFGGVSSRSQYQEKRVGITLDVLPLINPDGLVVMDISQNVQQLGPTVTIDGNPVPTTTERTANAKVAVRDRETIILGGFISTSTSKLKSGVPFLKDIPLLGQLFRSTVDSKQRVELIAMIRPTVLPTPEAASLAATLERNKLPGVHRAQIEYDKDEADRLKKFEESYKKELELEKQGSRYDSSQAGAKPADAKPRAPQEYQFEPVEEIK